MKITPLCDVFGKCGGCKFQDVEYSAQIAIKKNDIYELLNRSGISWPKERIKIFFKNEYYYRNRMDLILSEDGCGLREKGKFYKIVNFNRCHIASEKINRLLSEVNLWMRDNVQKEEIFDIRKKTGNLRYCVIRAGIFTDDNSIMFILNKDAEKEKTERMIDKIRLFTQRTNSKNVLCGFVKHNTDVSITDDFFILKGTEFINEKIFNVNYRYHSQGFFQSNPGVTTDMLFYIKDKIKEKYDLLFDMFGGIGTFGIFLSDFAKDVIVFDNNKYADVYAKKNIEINGKQNIIFVKDDIQNVGGLTSSVKDKKSVFIIDPPRAGLHKRAIKFILDTLPEKIFYISCNPVKFVEDFKNIDKKYSLIDFALFDMFPQTPHVESIAELELKR
ncbi:MAG: 23S rRNA (uracil(1939)-C(5))-methyltransferase RlmD [Candidatus Goldbacteria bacterium]|nr:23S rRNA (uracil(1939)-C(5))-methyltransferase RlmD [Candidatus Goldiibacteriota bacterium]